MNRRKLSRVVSTVAINVAFLSAINLAFGGLGCAVSATDAADERHEAQESAEQNAVMAAHPIDPRIEHIQSQLSRSTWKLRDAIDSGASYKIGADAQIGSKTYRYIVDVAKAPVDDGVDVTTRMLKTYKATLIGPDGETIEDSSLIVHAALQIISNVSESDFKKWSGRSSNAAALALMSEQLRSANMTQSTPSGEGDCMSRALWLATCWTVLAAGIAAAIATIAALWSQIVAAAAALWPVIQAFINATWVWLSQCMAGTAGSTAAFTASLQSVGAAITTYLSGPALAALAWLVTEAVAGVGSIVTGAVALVTSSYQWVIDCKTDPTIGNGRDGYTSVSCAQSSPTGTYDPNIARDLCRGVVSNWVTSYRSYLGWNYWTCGDCWASPGYCSDSTVASCNGSITACVMLTTQVCLAQPVVVAGGTTGTDGGTTTTTTTTTTATDGGTTTTTTDGGTTTMMDGGQD